MAEIVNLRQARKAKKRSEEARQAEENRTRFGLTKIEKRRQRTEKEQIARALDGARRSPSGDEFGKDER